MGTTTQGILINPLAKVGLISKNTTGLWLWHIPCMTPECGCSLAIAFSTLGPSIIGRSTTVEINVFINIWVLRKMGYFYLIADFLRKTSDIYYYQKLCPSGTQKNPYILFLKSSLNMFLLKKQTFSPLLRTTTGKLWTSILTDTVWHFFAALSKSWQEWGSDKDLTPSAEAYPSRKVRRVKLNKYSRLPL